MFLSRGGERMVETKTREIKYSELKERKGSFGRFAPFVLIFALILLLESTVFQYRYYHPILTGAEQKSYTASDFAVSGDGKKLTVTVDYVETKVTCISLDTVGADSYELSATWYDDASLSQSSGKKQTIHRYTERGSDYYLNTRGNCSKLVLNISSDSSIAVSGVALNSPAYDIRWLRIIFFTLAASGIYLLAKLKPWKKSVLPDRLSQRTKTFSLTTGMVYIIFMFAILLLSPGMEVNTEHCSIARLIYENPDPNDAYMMQTDALAKGQIQLDIIPSDELLALDNPYDPAQRSGVSYTWDFAFYNGAYYSYFGIVPVVLVLLPFRLITGMFLSSYVFSFMLAAAAAAVLCMVYREAVRKFIPNISDFAYIIGLISVLCCSFLAYPAARSWFYEIPYTSSLLCVFLALYFALRYDRAKRKGLALMLCGVCYALAVGCRPIALLSALLIAPIIISSIGKSYTQYLYFALPTAAIGILLGVWNIIRFGSFFDFGNAYQLTVSDIRYNSALDLPVTLDGTFRYLFGEVRFDNVFPFFFAKHSDITDMSHAMYSQSLTGIIRYPIYLCIGLLPFVSKRDTRFARFALCGIVAAAIIIPAVAASGGVCERYTLDFRWIFALIGTLCALKLMSERGHKRTSYNLIFGAAAAVSVAISLAICIMGEFNRMPTTSAGFYAVMRDTFELLY